MQVQPQGLLHARDMLNQVLSLFSLGREEQTEVQQQQRKFSLLRAYSSECRPSRQLTAPGSGQRGPTPVSSRVPRLASRGSLMMKLAAANASATSGGNQYSYSSAGLAHAGGLGLMCDDEVEASLMEMVMGRHALVTQVRLAGTGVLGYEVRGLSLCTGMSPQGLGCPDWGWACASMTPKPKCIPALLAYH